MLRLALVVEWHKKWQFARFVEEFACTYVFAKVGEAFLALKVVDIFLWQDTLFRTLSFLYGRVFL